MEITVNASPEQRSKAGLVSSVAEWVLKGEAQDGEVSISLVCDAHIKELNNKYLGRNRATDVLAFPMQEGEFSGINPSLLGDIVISFETAKRQAKEENHSFKEEIVLLTIHGTLHLLGYDHEVDSGEMRTFERSIMEELKEQGIL